MYLSLFLDIYVNFLAKIYVADPALPIPQLMAYNVPGSFQLPQRAADSVHALLADFRKPSGGVVPVLRQGQHHGKQPLGLEGQLPVA